MAQVGNADKRQVVDRLREALNWCTAHGDDTFRRFGACVDDVIDVRSEHNAEMRKLFPVLLQDNLSGYRPGITLKETALELDHASFLDLYFTEWANKFERAWRKLPSQRIATPKTAATDPALIRMVEPRAGSLELAEAWARHHNLYMSAENVGGNLLEEYIYTRIRDYDWIWCRGEVLTAVDFCSMDKERFVQIKNKSNTENSSGKGFREAHHAEKWYRMEAKRRQGRVVTRWPELVDIIRGGTDRSVPDDLMSEESYLDFVRDVASQNPDLITGEE